MKHDHPQLNIEGNTKSLFISVKDEVDDDLSSILHEFLHKKLKYDKNKQVFLLPAKNLSIFTQDIQSIVDEVKRQQEEDEENNKEDEEHNEDESSDSDDSDEDTVTIQKALARRVKLKSRQDVINDETISDSEHEDVITMTRRIRFLLQEIKALKARVAKLENK